jgi:flagellar biosynthesis component FlhA
MAYSSLFDYLTKHLGYSAGSAQRRIDAARLMKEVPELSEKLESGSLNLSQVSLVQKAIRQKKVQISNKLEILESLENKSFFESQTIVAKALDIEIKEQTKITNQKDESVRLEVTLTKSQWEKLQQMKSLLPNGSGEWSEVLEYLADKVIMQKIKARTAPKPSAKRINISMRKHIRNRDQCCQHKDKTTGRICGTKLNLQIDHIKPIWAGGQSTIENLQLLCANHNRYRYQLQTGNCPS